MNIKKTDWDLSLLFNGDNDPEMKKERIKVEQKSSEFINKWENRNDYLSNPKVLKEALDEYEEWFRYFGIDGKEGYYFWLRSSQDGDNPEIKAKLNKIEAFGKSILNNIRFFEFRLAKISQDKQKEFLTAEDLKEYRHFLEKIFEDAKYLLSESEEKILTLKSEASHSNWVKMINDFLSKEEKEVLLENGKKEAKSFSEIISLISNKDKKVRDFSAGILNNILIKHSDAAEAEINSILANKKIDDELRKMPRPDLSRHISDDVDSGVVDILIESVTNRFDISKKYYKFKSKLMGVESLEYYEKTVPYGKIDKEYSYQEAVSLVFKVFKKLDKKFAEIFKRFVEGGQVDVFPKKGKSGGAFCANSIKEHPTYLLLNHTGKLQDVLTLAHETGHGINSEFIKESQNALNFGTPLSTAEVASTFMEDFVMEELLENADDELRLEIMMDKLDSDISTIFRQVACYNFEKEMHESFRGKGYLSKKEIGEIFKKHMASYMGDSVEFSAGSENWWVPWGHIRSFFYVYSYASGLLISKFMQNSLKQDAGFIKKVKGFLSAGVSDSPKNIFKKLGIDIADKNFWESGIKETEQLLKNAEDLARKLGKI